MPRENVPEGLRPWIPWVLHGNETIAWPAGPRQCAEPGLRLAEDELELELNAEGGGFRLRAETFGRETWLPLPGSGEHWPRT
ncbi:MAG: hypothetical protein MZW92_08095 [Comamonadaceae bacterium]|nr:hypothetical protein [Comamonadaceae bacterium]